MESVEVHALSERVEIRIIHVENSPINVLLVNKKRFKQLHLQNLCVFKLLYQLRRILDSYESNILRIRIRSKRCGRSISLDFAEVCALCFCLDRVVAPIILGIT